MATQLQIRRGTAAQVAAFTGAEGEIVYNSTNDSLHTNDGATAGGFELARADLNNVLDADLNAALTGNTLSALTITTLTAGAATFSGNVGIGIAPNNKLTVFGTGVGNATVQIEGEGGADPYINFLTNNAQHWSLGVDDSDGDKFKLSEHSALGINDYLTVDVNGNVGIGISAPVRQASIYGASSAAISFHNSTTGSLASDGLFVGNDANLAYLYNYEATPIVFATSGTERARLNSDGNLGLGTSAPSAKLEVAGSSNSTYLIAGGDDSTNGRALTFTSSSSASFQGAVHTINAPSLQGVIAFATGSAEAMRISSGNLLVGTTDDAVWNNTAGNGINLRGDLGLIASARTNAESAMFNRMGTDGEVIKINKNGATVGNIGTNGTHTYFVGNDSAAGNGCGLLFGINTATPVNRLGIPYDGTMNLGSSGARFKDLYLSGTANLNFINHGETIYPTTDAAVDIGTSGERYRNLYLSGSANVANVFAGGSVTSSFFTTGTFNYTSGTTAIITIPGNTTYLFMARPTNYGGGDSRHGAVYIIRRWGGHTANAVQLAQSASNYGVFTVSAAGTVSYSGTGGGLPSTPIYWMRIA